MEPPRLLVFLVILGLTSTAPRPNNLVLVGQDGQPGPLLVAALNLMEGRKGVEVEEILEKEQTQEVEAGDDIFPREAPQERSWVVEEEDEEEEEVEEEKEEEEEEKEKEEEEECICS